MLAALREITGPILEGVLRFIPDKNKRAKARESFDSEMLGALTALVQGQLAINQQEAKHPSIFVAGARPAILWICAAALAWNYLLQPIVQWVVVLVMADPPAPPALDTSELITILGGLLGLGGLRTYEKRLGVARESL